MSIKAGNGKILTATERQREIAYIMSKLRNPNSNLKDWDEVPGTENIPLKRYEFLSESFYLHQAERQAKMEEVESIEEEYYKDPISAQLLAAEFHTWTADEIFEALKWIPGAKPWKRKQVREMTDHERGHFLEEAMDVYIQWTNVLIFLGFTIEEINNSMDWKLRYNQLRPDHDCNAQ